MEHIVMEREYDAPMSEQAFREMAMSKASCMGLYRVHWHESLLALDGRRLVCRFEAPDSESLRQMSRDDGSSGKVVWQGVVHDTGRTERANVAVTRRFEEPTTVEALQALEDAAADCLALHRVTFLRTFFSSDGRRMICLYNAPDAESVRIAQQTAAMPVDQLWPCHSFSMENLLPED